MRVGVNCYILSEQIGGMKQYFHRLFNELLIKDDENSYVFFYFHHNVEELGRLHTDRWKKDAILLASQDEIVRYLEKIDLFFCPFGALWPRPVNVPSVVTIPDIQEKYYPTFFSKQDLFNRAMYYDPSTQIADRVITISQFSKDSIIRHHGRPGKKIHVAYLCADDAYCSNELHGCSDSVPLPKKFIFYPANRWVHKNHDRLLQALAILKERHGMAIDCVFTGHDIDGGYPLASRAREYGLSGQVFIMGYLSSSEIRTVYRKAEMLCFPSLFEGFGMPVLEAMMLGCPVVCSNTSSLPEVGGDAALYFDPNNTEELADRIRELWNNKELKERLIAKGRRQSMLFSADAMAKKHIAVFHEAMDAFSINHYYYNKFIYEPLYRLKMTYLKRKYGIH